MNTRFSSSRRTLLIAAAAAIALPVRMAAAAPASDGRALLEAFLARAKGGEGTFRQQTRDRNGNVTGSAEGRFVFLRPGAFDWSYTKPYSQQIVSDGKTLWIYDEDLMQVTVRPIGEGLDATPAAVLFGSGRIPEDWGVESAERVLTLTPPEAVGGFERIVIRFSAEGVPATLELSDSFGQTTTVEFPGFAAAEPPADRFAFKVPEGVDVVEASF